MSNYSDFLRDHTEELLARTEMSPEEQAEHEERARRNKIDRIMAQPAPQPPAATALPPLSEKRAGDAPAGAYATRKWVNGQTEALVKGTGQFVTEFVRKRFVPLQQEVEQQGRVNEALGRQVDKILAELATLKRDIELEKKLEVQRTKRRTEMLELENSLLRAGRRPDDARDEAEGELPGRFSEWNGGGHAQ